MLIISPGTRGPKTTAVKLFCSDDYIGLWEFYGEVPVNFKEGTREIDWFSQSFQGISEIFLKFLVVVSKKFYDPDTQEDFGAISEI